MSNILTSKQIPTTTIQPSTTLQPVTASTTSTKTVEKIDVPGVKASRSETISSTIESYETETKSEQKFHMKLEHKTPLVVDSKSETEEKITRKKIDHDEKDAAEQSTSVQEKSETENENIETSAIAKKDALSFFESITKESEIIPKGPKEMIKLTEDGQVREANVGKLTKSYERASFHEVKKSEQKHSDFQTTKKTVQDIFNKLEQGPSSRGVENKLFEFPYESPDISQRETKKTILEDMVGSKSISQLQTQKDIFEMTTESFNLMPEPPPEICYMPKPEEAKKKHPDVFIKAKQLQESFDKALPPIDAPIGGVKIFPTLSPKVSETVKVVTSISSVSPSLSEFEKRDAFEKTFMKKDMYEKRESKCAKEEKMEPSKYSSTSIIRTASPVRPWSSSSDLETKSHISTDLSEYRCHSAASSHQEIPRSTSPKPSMNVLAMEKSWAKKYPDSNRKSWPPQAESTRKHEWNMPSDEYKSSFRESKQEIEKLPQGGIKKTSIESSDSIQKRSYSDKQEFTKILKTEESPSALKLGPIIYNAETIKVDHTINVVQEKTLYEKYISECDVQKTETSKKCEEFRSKRWKDDEQLKAPSLVKKVDPPMKPFSTLQQFTEPEVQSTVLETKSSSEIKYFPSSTVKEEYSTTIHQPVAPWKKEEPPVIPPRDFQVVPPPVPLRGLAKPSPTVSMPTKFMKSSFSYESDYESDLDRFSKAKWRPYESDNEEPHYRRVKAPVQKQPMRPRSTELEPLPPSKFETPMPQGPSRPFVDKESSEKTTKKAIFKRYEKECKQQQQQSTTPITLRPGSPPIYIQPSTKSFAPRSPPTKKPESPKFKAKVFQQESGYMADTDEPFQQKVLPTVTQKFLGKRDTKTKYFEEHNYKDQNLQKEESSFISSSFPSMQSTPEAIVQQQQSSFEKSHVSMISPCRFESVKVRDLLRVSVSFRTLSLLLLA